MEKFETLINANNRLDNKEYLIKILSLIDKVIPDNSKSNMYRNLKTLKVNLHLDLDLSNIPPLKKGADMGKYNTIGNTINLCEDGLYKIWRFALKYHSDNPKAYYDLMYRHNLTHELIHMCSTEFNEKEDYVASGFDKGPSSEEIDKNKGLTEGFTDMLTTIIVPIPDVYKSGYYIESCIVKQLIYIIGINILSESFFSNSGVKPLQDKLNILIDNEKLSYDLFRNIEKNFEARNENKPNELLGNIQNTLLDYLDKKLEKLRNHNEIDIINKTLKLYESAIVDNEALAKNNKNPFNYTGIDENIARFSEIKEKYKNIRQL